MNALVVDTSVWIESFRGRNFHQLDVALKQGEVVLPPLVLSEILSGARSKKDQARLEDFFSFIPLHPVGRGHWKRVGFLRGDLLKKGLAVSIPDCHIAQCAIEMEGSLLSLDHIFSKIAKWAPLQVI